MKRRRLIICAALAVIIVGAFVWAKSRRPADLTRVTMGFAGFEMADGKRMAVFCVTNGSGVRISQPIFKRIRGTTVEGAIGYVDVYFWPNRSYGLTAPRWKLSQWKVALEPGIGSGETYRAIILPPEGLITWEPEAGFRTIPFRFRLPPILQSLWRKPENESDIMFCLTPPEINVVTGLSVTPGPSKLRQLTNPWF